MSDEIKAPEVGESSTASVYSIQSTMESFYETAAVDRVYG